MHNRPSNQILPHNDTPFCLCKPEEIMNAHQTRHENPAKKKVFLHSTWGKKKGFYFVSSCFSTALIGAIRSLLFNSVICSLGGSLSAVGLRRSTSNINCLLYHWTSFDFIRSFINKQLNTFHFKQLLIHT